MSQTNRPLTSLREGCWFKLICGASYHHLPSIQNLALAYALAGADCIDVAADPSVVMAVRSAFQVLAQLSKHLAPLHPLHEFLPDGLPWLMVSVSDGEDLHFRKATFDPRECPPMCDRPCEQICPANAIAFPLAPAADLPMGVLENRCYGCGRCLPVCPYDRITTLTQSTSIATIAPALMQQVDAIEIHTHVGHYEAFLGLWQVMRPYLDNLCLISISCPEEPGVLEYLWQLYHAIQPLPVPLIWQTDGRAMSGDIGKGTTHATLRYAQKVLQSGPPGFVQLAGGTNAHTASKLLSLLTDAPPASVLSSSSAEPAVLQAARFPTFGGVAYGSFARRLMSPLLDIAPRTPDAQESEAPGLARRSASSSLAPSDTHAYVPHPMETFLPWLTEAVPLAHSLVAPLKATVQPLCRPTSLMR